MQVEQLMASLDARAVVGLASVTSGDGADLAEEDAMLGSTEVPRL